MITSHFTIDHVRLVTDKNFTDVTRSLEDHLGRFDPTVLQSLRPDTDRVDDVKSRIEAMARPSGFMLFGTIDHGELLSLFGQKRRAIQYVVGNPLIALQMTRHNVAAGLYAPLRLIVFEDENGETHIEYDQPSSLFGQFNDDRITSVAEQLVRKMEELVRVAVE